MFDSIIPHPQSWTATGGACDLARLTACAVSSLDDPALAVVREDWPGVRFSRVDRPGFSAILSATGDGSPPDVASARIPPREEGYALAIAPERIEIAANDRDGLLRGLSALATLRDISDGAIPAGMVRDWPAIRRRGVHIDLKGYQPRFDRLLELCGLLARYRINAILLEVEDKFAFRSAPEVGVPGAYTAAEFRRLGEHCEALGIAVIPKLQCIGHVDYILKHPRYAHLRENGHPFMTCPRNDEALDLWRAMTDELIDCFPGHPWFHIGADETANLGECPVCKPYSKSASYVHRVEKAIAHLRARDRRPIMWEDILRHPQDGSDARATWSLGKECVLNYWWYGNPSPGSDPLPMMGSYLDAGMRVWGASAFSGAGPTMIEDIPPLASRAPNVALWTRVAQERGLEGVIATSWTKFRSGDPPAESTEASWPSLLYAAESMWWGAERPLAAFVPIMARAFWGTDIALYSRFMRSMSAGDLPREPDAVPAAVASARRNADRLALWIAGAEFQRHKTIRNDMMYLLHMYHGTLGDRLPDYILDRVRVIADRLRDSIALRRPMLADALAAFYGEPGVSEVLASRFGRDELLLGEADELVAKTKYA